jgi:predicted N-acetyltransferase YhbS
MVIRPEMASDVQDINKLHDEAFGPGRFAKTAYRVREGREPLQMLSLVALDGERLVGSIRFTQIRIGSTDGALLLGPLAVFLDYSGHRCGLRLMSKGLDMARELGFKLVLLVGDLGYYQKVGFLHVPAGQIEMPGPVDNRRMLACELKTDALAGFSGMVGL